MSMSIGEIEQLALNIIAAVGGISGILLTIKSIASVVTALKNSVAYKQIKALIEEKSQRDLEAIRQGLIDGLNCQFDINITDKFKEMFNAQFAEIRAYMEQSQKQTVALKSLMCHIAEMYQRSKSLTADERAELGKVIEAAKNIITEPIAAPKPTVLITYNPAPVIKESAIVENAVAEDTKFEVFM